MILSITWPDVIAGALLGFLLGNLPNIKNIVISTLKDPYEGYYGKYYLYGYLLETNEHDKYIDYIEVVIRKNRIGLPIVEYSDDQYNCKGKFYFDEKNAYFHLKGSNHDGDYFIIFHKPLVANDFDLMLGAKTLITEKADPAATINLISKDVLSDEDAKALLGARKVLIVRDRTKFKERSVALKNKKRLA